MSPDPIKPLPGTMDDAEPSAGRSPAPVLLIGLFALLVYLGMVYLENHGGGFNPHVYQPYASFQQLSDLQPTDHTRDVFNKGQRFYQTTCVVCHQPNGAGSAAQFAPPLAGSEWVNAEGPNRVIRIVLYGLRGPVTVKGVEFSAGIMAHWGDVYKDDGDLAALLTYIRGNKEWGNTAPPVTPEQVKAIRDKTKTRDLEQFFTVPELLKIPEKD